MMAMLVDRASMAADTSELPPNFPNQSGLEVSFYIQMNESLVENEDSSAEK